jgi:hypothetical protein
MLAFEEDGGGIEAQGVTYRQTVIKRHDVGPRFRRMILLLSWIWGLGLILIAVISTILIMLLQADIGFVWNGDCHRLFRLVFNWDSIFCQIAIAYREGGVESEEAASLNSVVTI